MILWHLLNPLKKSVNLSRSGGSPCKSDDAQLALAQCTADPAAALQQCCMNSLRSGMLATDLVTAKCTRSAHIVLTPIAKSVCQVSMSHPFWLYRYIARVLTMATMCRSMNKSFCRERDCTNAQYCEQRLPRLAESAPILEACNRDFDGFVT